MPYPYACVPLVSCVCVPVTFHITSRVQIAFHITLLLTPRYIKRFHITHHSITSHQFFFTPHHILRYTIPFHMTPPLHNISHRITTYHTFHATSRRHLMLQHISPRTTIFYIWDHITLQSASAPPFHTTTTRSTCCTSHSHSQHFTPFHIHN